MESNKTHVWRIVWKGLACWGIYFVVWVLEMLLSYSSLQIEDKALLFFHILPDLAAVFSAVLLIYKTMEGWVWSFLIAVVGQGVCICVFPAVAKTIWHAQNGHYLFGYFMANHAIQVFRSLVCIGLCAIGKKLIDSICKSDNSPDE